MSFSETIFLFFLALIIFGPKKLPEIARVVGKYLNEFRRASNDFKAQIEQEIAHLEVEKKTATLPPSRPVEGTASRTLGTVTPPTETTAPETPATLASTQDAPPLSDNGQPPVATEAVHPSDEVTSPASQESHA